MLREGSRSRSQKGRGTETGDCSGMAKASDTVTSEATLDSFATVESFALEIRLKRQSVGRVSTSCSTRIFFFASLIWGSVGVGYFIYGTRWVPPPPAFALMSVNNLSLTPHPERAQA